MEYHLNTFPVLISYVKYPGSTYRVEGIAEILIENSTIERVLRMKKKNVRYYGIYFNDVTQVFLWYCMP